MQKLCIDCGNIKSPKGDYCKPCGYKHRSRPSGLIYKIVSQNRSWFKKGESHSDNWYKVMQNHTPWNKDMKGLQLSPGSGFKKGETKGELNFNWKGDKVGYTSLHTWVYRNLGKAKKCIKCSSIKNVQWANKSWEYKRDLDDWLELCAKCHRGYDKANIGAAMRKYPELRRYLCISS